jgi:hypothetical protein
MKRVQCILLVALVALTSAASAEAATMFFDFGSATTQTAGNYNNVTPSMLPILNALDLSGGGTGIGLETSGFNENGPNTAGTSSPTGDAAIFDAEATRDSLFGHSSNFNIGGPRTPGLLNFSGLDTSGLTSYTFTFLGSRIGGPNRETQYDVVGANNASVLLNAADNTSNVVNAPGILPTAAGTISVTVSAGSNNGTGTDQFFYLGALRLESVAVPEPATIGLVLIGMAAACLRRR